MSRVTIDPLTRVEGHGRVEIVLDEAGEVENAVLVVPELRGFERLCVGRPAEEMPWITSRICGLCPEAHLMASVKALDAIFRTAPPPAALAIRELFYCTFFVLDHATHFFMLAGPDLFVGPDAPVEERTFFGVVRKLGPELGKRVVEARLRNARVIELLGGRAVHPVAAVPGGWSRSVDEALRPEIEGVARANVDFAVGALELFERAVLAGGGAAAELMRSPAFAERTYSMGTVDGRNRAAVYDGHIRAVDPDGKEQVKFAAADYATYIAERVEPWTYVKFPHLITPGWRGFAEGPESGVYVASPLGRLNAADGMATPLAQRQLERLRETLGDAGIAGGSRPVHNRMATHWARLIELLAASERMLELAHDPLLCSPEVRAPVRLSCGEGIGSVEAPRGTLLHHYRTDERGIITAVNLVVGTTNNHAAMSLSIARAARALIGGGRVAAEPLLNRLEMVIRAYDPCLSCATHAYPDGRSLQVLLRDRAGNVLRTIRRE